MTVIEAKQPDDERAVIERIKDKIRATSFWRGAIIQRVALRNGRPVSDYDHLRFVQLDRFYALLAEMSEPPTDDERIARAARAWSVEGTV